MSNESKINSKLNESWPLSIEGRDFRGRWENEILSGKVQPDPRVATRVLYYAACRAGFRIGVHSVHNDQMNVDEDNWFKTRESVVTVLADYDSRLATNNEARLKPEELVVVREFVRQTINGNNIEIDGYLAHGIEGYMEDVRNTENSRACIIWAEKVLIEGLKTETELETKTQTIGIENRDISPKYKAIHDDIVKKMESGQEVDGVKSTANKVFESLNREEKLKMVDGRTLSEVVYEISRKGLGLMNWRKGKWRMALDVWVNGLKQDEEYPKTVEEMKVLVNKYKNLFD